MMNYSTFKSFSTFKNISINHFIESTSLAYSKSTNTRINLLKKHGINPKISLQSHQFHTNNILLATKENLGLGVSLLPKKNQKYDALLSNIQPSSLIIYTADCLPIFFYFKDKQAIGLAHSGLIGTIKQISSSLIDKAISALDINPKFTHVIIGPSIKKCCYNISPTDCRLGTKKKYFKKNNYLVNNYLDLPKIVLNELVSSGIKKQNITKTSICTCCHNSAKFPSHRREGKNRKSFLYSTISLHEPS